MTQSTEIVQMYNEINPKDLDVTEMKENDRSVGQKIAFFKHKHDASLVFGLPWILINAHGIPNKADFYKNESQRMFIKLPLDKNVPESKDLADWTERFDQYFGSDEMKEKLFGTKKDKYQYQPCFRLPQEDDEEHDKKNPKKNTYGPKPPYLKLKIDTSFPDGKIAAPIYKSVMENGKRVRTRIKNIDSIDELLHDHISFLSKVRVYATLSKVWAHNLKSTQNPKYGITFKMIKAEYEPRQRNNSNIHQFIQSDIFLEDECDGNMGLPQPPPRDVPGKKVELQSKLMANTAEVDTSDSDESDDEENDKSMKVPVKVIEQDSDEEEPVLAAKQPIHDDSDSDEEPKKPVKKNVKSKSKVR